MAGPDTHMAVDASKKATGGVLFQLHGQPAGTEAGPEHRSAECIICFFSFKSMDAETRYSNSELEALAVIRGLAEVKWMISASPHPTFVYMGHEALKTLLVGKDNDAHGRIANWQHRLGEYNLLLRHRSCNVHFMGIADGMSRLPTRLQQHHIMEDADKPDISVTTAFTVQVAHTTAGIAWKRRASGTGEGYKGRDGGTN